MNKNIAFLNAIDPEIKNDILESIAKHYQITIDEAYEEVSSDEAEHLIEYMTGAKRTATYILMQKHNFV